MKNIHKGHITALTWADADDPDLGHLFVSGGQDGWVCDKAGEGGAAKSLPASVSCVLRQGFEREGKERAEQ